MSTDDLASRTRDEVEAAARKWFEVATELSADLEKALNLCQEYQRFMAMLSAPDPNIVEVRRLFKKYNMVFTENDRAHGIFIDGKDITSNPEDVNNIVELDVERVELILDEHGKMRFIPAGQGTVEVPGQDWEAEDVAFIEDVDLGWLQEPNDLSNEEVQTQQAEQIRLASGTGECCHKCGMYLNIHPDECVYVFQGGA